MFERLSRWFRRRPLAAESDWDAAIQALPLLHGLDADERARLIELSERFLRSKSLEPVGDFVLDLPMRLEIALQACLPILNLGLEYYRNWYSVVVYPTGFMVEHEFEEEDGTIHRRHGELVGEAWERGPVILSWDDVVAGRVRDGFNVIIHEFAHKLDMLQGTTNGLPPLHRTMSAADWSEAFVAAYEDLCRRVEANEPSPAVDDYGAESPGEFFAVVSEAFFEIPHELQLQYPEVYRQLSLFYRQDPKQRLSPMDTD